MARGYYRKPSFWKIIGAYRSQWKRSFMRGLFPSTYGKRGMGWWHNPKKAAYNWWYNRTSVNSYDHGLFHRERPSKNFIGFVLGVGFICSLVTLPFDLIEACRKGYRIQKRRKQRAAAKRAKQQKSASQPQRSQRTEATSRTASASVEGKAPAKRAVPPAPITEHLENAPAVATFQPPASTKVTAKKSVAQPDEDTPKSKPRHEGDQYIRKRLYIAGASYCDDTVTARLTVGSELELVAEPGNPVDRNAVMLLLAGEKVGYVPKSETLPYVTCLKLGRRIYGVVTEILAEPYPTKYEFETWFDLS